MDNKILIVEDEQKLNTMIADYLQISGFKTLQVFDGREAIKVFEQENPDLIVLDLMIPGMDGFAVIRHVRQFSPVPIIILTARATETDKLVGLEIGADDYVVKPFSIKELAARVRAVLRRTTGNQAQAQAQAQVQTQPQASNPGIMPKPHNQAEPTTVIKYKDLQLDTDKQTVTRTGEKINLTSVQFVILKGMMQRPGKVFTRMELLNSFQETSFDGYERTIDVHIKNIRKALEKDPAHPEYIQTVWGTGYKLTEEE